MRGGKLKKCCDVVHSLALDEPGALCFVFVVDWTVGEVSRGLGQPGGTQRQRRSLVLDNHIQHVTHPPPACPTRFHFVAPQECEEPEGVLLKITGC